AVMTATLSKASNQVVRFDIESGAYGGADAASPGSDFNPLRQQGLEIPAGQTSLQFGVSVLGDWNVEGDERFYLAIGGVQGAALADSIIQVTIRNDDQAGSTPALPVLSVADASLPEGSAGVQDRNVQVRLSAPAAQEVRFALLAQDLTARGGEDYR